MSEPTLDEAVEWLSKIAVIPGNLSPSRMASVLLRELRRRNEAPEEWQREAELSQRERLKVEADYIYLLNTVRSERDAALAQVEHLKSSNRYQAGYAAGEKSLLAQVETLRAERDRHNAARLKAEQEHLSALADCDEARAEVERLKGELAEVKAVRYYCPRCTESDMPGITKIEQQLAELRSERDAAQKRFESYGERLAELDCETIPELQREVERLKGELRAETDAHRLDVTLYQGELAEANRKLEAYERAAEELRTEFDNRSMREAWDLLDDVLRSARLSPPAPAEEECQRQKAYDGGAARGMAAMVECPCSRCVQAEPQQPAAEAPPVDLVYMASVVEAARQGRLAIQKGDQPAAAPVCPYCTKPNLGAIYFDQTCRGCVDRMGKDPRPVPVRPNAKLLWIEPTAEPCDCAALAQDGRMCERHSRKPELAGHAFEAGYRVDRLGDRVCSSCGRPASEHQQPERETHV